MLCKSTHNFSGLTPWSRVSNKRQKQPCRGVLKKSNFIEITLRHGCSSVNLLHIFRAPFLKNTSGWLLLKRKNLVYSFFMPFGWLQKCYKEILLKSCHSFFQIFQIDFKNIKNHCFLLQKYFCGSSNTSELIHFSTVLRFIKKKTVI